MNRSGFVALVLGGMFILLSSSPAKASTVINTLNSTCPYRITQSGDYVLAADITCEDSLPGTSGDYSDGIVVYADNVTIRLKGFSIRCSATGNSASYKMSC